MISAKKAYFLFNTAKIYTSDPININSGLSHKLRAGVLAIVQYNVIEAAKNGFTSCVSYLLDTTSEDLLKAHGYIVEEEIEENLSYHVISWDKDADKSESRKRKGNGEPAAIGGSSYVFK